MKIGTLITGIAILVVVTALAYMAGAATASDGSEGSSGLLSRLQLGRDNDIVDRTMSLLDTQYFKTLSDSDKEKLQYGAVDGIMNVLHREPFDDQFSNFYNPELYADLQAQTTGEYAGIGILMGLSADGMYPEVATVFENTPALEAGLRVGDIIVEADGEDMFGMILPNVATIIKGEPGTTIEIQIYRPDDDDFHDYTIERRSVEFSSVPNFEMLGEGIGLIEVSTFAQDTLVDFRDAMDELMAQGMEVLVIDLRNNTGGLFDAAIELASCFMDEGTVVQVQRRNEFEKMDAVSSIPKYDIPVVVLQNSSSASASEILTGALKDSGIAVVVGEKSFGKGVIQAVLPLEFQDDPQPGMDDVKSALAITIGSYLTPNGSDIHGQGIEPNVWYDINNQLQDDPELTRLQDELEKKRDEMREIRSQMTTHLRENDSILERAKEIAGMVKAGETVEDVPQLEPEEDEHAPLGSGVSVTPEVDE